MSGQVREIEILEEGRQSDASRARGQVVRPKIDCVRIVGADVLNKAQRSTPGACVLTGARRAACQAPHSGPSSRITQGPEGRQRASWAVLTRLASILALGKCLRAPGWGGDRTMLRFLATIAAILWIVVGAVEIVSLARPPGEPPVHSENEAQHNQRRIKHSSPFIRSLVVGTFAAQIR